MRAYNRVTGAIRMAARAVHLDVRRYRGVAGYDLRQYFPRVCFLDTLGARSVLDVGANRGQFARALRAAGYRGRIVSFEPVRTAYEELAARAAGESLWEARRLALGRSDGTQVINVAANTAGSSFLTVRSSLTTNNPEMAFVATEDVECRTLDSLAAEGLSVEGAYLKLDVQGYEDEVLAGSGEVLGQMVGLELELSFTPLYEEEGRFTETLDSLRGAGFELASVFPGLADRATGLPMQVDALFRRCQP